MTYKKPTLTPTYTAMYLFGLEDWKESLDGVLCLEPEDREELLSAIPTEGQLQRPHVSGHWAHPKTRLDMYQTPQNERLSNLFLVTRERLGLGQRGLAAALGLTPGTVKNIERCLQFSLNTVSQATLRRLIEHDEELMRLHARIDWDLAKRGRAGHPPAAGW